MVGHQSYPLEGLAVGQEPFHLVVAYQVAGQESFHHEGEAFLGVVNLEEVGQGQLQQNEEEAPYQA